jgi:hypothetical protein
MGNEAGIGRVWATHAAPSLPIPGSNPPALSEFPIPAFRAPSFLAPALHRLENTMRILRPAPQVLEARNVAIAPRVIGGLLMAAALALAARADAVREPVQVWVAIVACFCVAILIWRGVSAQVVTLDRGNGVVRVRTQHVLGTSSVEHRLVDISDVVLERRPIGDGRDEFRPAFVMRNGTHQGWGTHTLNYAQADQISAVRLVREFLGTAASPTAPDGSVAIQGI